MYKVFRKSINTNDRSLQNKDNPWISAEACRFCFWKEKEPFCPIMKCSDCECFASNLWNNMNEEDKKK